MKLVLCLASFLLFTDGQILTAQSSIRVPISIDTKTVFGTLDSAKVSVQVAGKEVRIVSVEQLNERHLQFVLLNDQSGLNKWPKGLRQQTFFEDVWLKTVMTAGIDRGSLVNYNDEFYLDAENTTDPSVVSRKIVREGRGGTATYSALLYASKWLKKQPVAAGYRKLLVLFSDGDTDNASDSSFKSLFHDIEKIGIPVYVILPETSKSLPGTPRLREIATSTGGDVYFVGVKDAGPDGFSSLKSELAQEVVLTLELPSGVPHGLQELSVTVSDPAWSVRAPSDIWIEK